MSNETNLYLERHPGDLITAEDWNLLQMKIKTDIKDQTQEAIEAIEKVKKADEADKLGGKTIEELTKEILEQALKAIPERTGYLQLFKKLEVDKESEVKHNLKAHPLVDIYQLDYFEVVCSEDGHIYKEWVNFFLYHDSEKRIRFKESEGASSESVEIESSSSIKPYRIPFKDVLSRYKVEYTDSWSLGNLETEFWKAFFKSPNDAFDDDQYCHSPWFDRCCREDTTVANLKSRGNWDDLWFQMRPRKTVNYPTDPNARGSVTTPAPTQIQVAHFDFDTLGMKLLTPPIHPNGLPEELKKKILNQLKVMLLLKV
jgi:hypothetical protein